VCFLRGFLYGFVSSIFMEPLTIEITKEDYSFYLRPRKPRRKEELKERKNGKPKKEETDRKKREREELQEHDHLWTKWALKNSH
jgi:hypothetical protein